MELWIAYVTFNNMKIVLKVFGDLIQMQNFILYLQDLGINFEKDSNDRYYTYFGTIASLLYNKYTRDELKSHLFGPFGYYGGCGEPNSLEIKRIKFDEHMSGFDLD